MKRLITWLLLAFVAVTLIVQIGNLLRHVEAAEIPDGVSVIFFHAKVRCPTCTAMEKFIHTTLDTHFPDETTTGNITLYVFDYESPESQAIAERFGVGTATVILLHQQDGEEITARNLAADCWKRVGDETAFCTMLKTNLDEVIQGKSVTTSDQTDEIILDLDESLFDE
jgi:hypothetical protein